MPYRYLEDIATADVAFEAWGDTVEAMFAAAADATLNVMVDELDDIRFTEQRNLVLSAESVEMLLFDMIQELIYYKDAEQLLLRVPAPVIARQEERFALTAEARGENDFRGLEGDDDTRFLSKKRSTSGERFYLE